jgi:hypothetical protein
MIKGRENNKNSNEFCFGDDENNNEIRGINNIE